MELGLREEGSKRGLEEAGDGVYGRMLRLFDTYGRS